MVERNELLGEVSGYDAVQQVRAELARFIQDEESRVLRGNMPTHEQYLAAVSTIKTLRSALKVLEVNGEN